MVSVVAIKDGSNKKPVFDCVIKEDDHEGLGRVCESLKLDQPVFDEAVASAIFNKKKVALTVRGMRVVIQAD